MLSDIVRSTISADYLEGLTTTQLIYSGVQGKKIRNDHEDTKNWYILTTKHNKKYQIHLDTNIVYDLEGAVNGAIIQWITVKLKYLLLLKRKKQNF